MPSITSRTDDFLRWSEHACLALLMLGPIFLVFHGFRTISSGLPIEKPFHLENFTLKGEQIASDDSIPVFKPDTKVDLHLEFNRDVAMESWEPVVKKFSLDPDSGVNLLKLEKAEGKNLVLSFRPAREGKYTLGMIPNQKVLTSRGKQLVVPQNVFGSSAPALRIRKPGAQISLSTGPNFVVVDPEGPQKTSVTYILTFPEEIKKENLGQDSFTNLATDEVAGFKVEKIDWKEATRCEITIQPMLEPGKITSNLELALKGNALQTPNGKPITLPDPIRSKNVQVIQELKANSPPTLIAKDSKVIVGEKATWILAFGEPVPFNVVQEVVRKELRNKHADQPAFTDPIIEQNQGDRKTYAISLTNLPSGKYLPFLPKDFVFTDKINQSRYKFGCESDRETVVLKELAWQVQMAPKVEVGQEAVFNIKPIEGMDFEWFARKLETRATPSNSVGKIPVPERQGNAWVLKIPTLAPGNIYIELPTDQLPGVNGSTMATRGDKLVSGIMEVVMPPSIFPEIKGKKVIVIPATEYLSRLIKTNSYEINKFFDLKKEGFDIFVQSKNGLIQSLNSEKELVTEKYWEPKDLQESFMGLEKAIQGDRDAKSLSISLIWASDLNLDNFKPEIKSKFISLFLIGSPVESKWLDEIAAKGNIKKRDMRRNWEALFQDLTNN